MVSLPRNVYVVSALGGVVYAAVVLSWILSSGVHFSTQDPVSTALALGYASLGTFLVAALPLVLLGRLSLVFPAITTLWLLGDAVYQDLYGTHLHPLSSYLTVWPLLLGFALATAVVEAPVRIALDRLFGRFELRSLV